MTPFVRLTALMACAVLVPTLASAQPTPQQQAAIQQVLTEHQQATAQITVNIAAQTQRLLTELSALVPPGMEPRFAAYAQQLLAATGMANDAFNAVPPPARTPDRAVAELASRILPITASFLGDIGAPPPVAATVMNRASQHVAVLATLFVTAEQVRRATRAKIEAILNAPLSSVTTP